LELLEINKIEHNSSKLDGVDDRNLLLFGLTVFFMVKKYIWHKKSRLFFIVFERVQGEFCFLLNCEFSGLLCIHGKTHGGGYSREEREKDILFSV